jgi:hypothetical protein
VKLRASKAELIHIESKKKYTFHQLMDADP